MSAWATCSKSNERRRPGTAAWLFAALVAFQAGAWARGVYQAPEAFLQEVFAGRPPPAQLLWLTDMIQGEAVRILGHRYPALRVRYWSNEGRSAWILEEIGKEEPITVGIVVESGKLELIRVLVFRESRGDEVRHSFFTRQFAGAALQADRQLDRPIDGITGATLSVRALTKLARFALYLHEQVAR